MKGIFMHQAISIHACFTTENHQLPLLGWIFARTRLRSKRRLLLLWEEEEFHQASRFSGGQTGPDQEGNQRTNTASLIWRSNWKKAKTHTHKMHYFCDDKVKLKERLKIWLCWTLTGLQLHSHHSSFYGPSGLIDGGFAALVCCWALKLCLIQSGMTFIVGDYLDYLLKLFFFFFIDVDHYEANRKIYISFFFFLNLWSLYTLLQARRMQEIFL